MITPAVGSPRPVVVGGDVGSGKDRVRVLIADDDGLARRMMSDTLQHADEIRLLAAAREGTEALELARYYTPAVLIVDTALPPSGCVKLISEVLREVPDAGWRPLRSRLTTREWEIVEMLGDEHSTQCNGRLVSPQPRGRGPLIQWFHQPRQRQPDSGAVSQAGFDGDSESRILSSGQETLQGCHELGSTHRS